MKRFLLVILGIFLTLLFAKNHPQSLIFPLWIFVYIFKERLSKFFAGETWKFILAGIIFGMIIEVFAIMQNVGQPESVRSITLFHPFAIPDLVLGFFYYAVMIVTWFVVLSKINFSTKEVFLLAGLFGIVFEQQGAILVAVLSGGVIFGVYVFLIHGIYPMLAYYLTKDNFSNDRKEPRWWHYIVTPLLLFLTWALISGSIFRLLKPLFG